MTYRAILESMNVTVNWDNETKTINCTKNGKTVTLAIGSKQMNVDDKTIELDVPAKIVNGRTLVPLRAITESFDANVEWDNATKTVSITTSDDDSVTSNSAIEELTEADTETTTEATTETTTEATEDSSSEGNGMAVLGDDGELMEINISVKENKALSEKAAEILKENTPNAEDYYKTILSNLGENGLTEKELEEDIKEDKKNRGADFAPYEYKLEVEAVEVDGYVTIKKTEVSFTGGAHPNTFISTETFDVETGKKAKLEDVAQKLLGKSAKDVVKAAKEIFVEKVKEYDDEISKAEENVETLNEENYYVSKDGITFFFNTYDIAPYAAGVIEATVEK